MLNVPTRSGGVPSYAKLFLMIGATAFAAYFPLKVHFAVRLEPPALEVTAPERAAPHRLFDEYPAVLIDQDDHPIETRSSIWVSVRHLSGAERAAAAAVWTAAPAVRLEVAAGLYRLELRGPAVAAMTRVLARYPYAVAPGERIDADLTAAYRRATGINRYRVCVVRGDWLNAALASEPALADRLGVTTSQADADRYRDEVLSSVVLLAAFPADGVGRLTPPTTVRRRSLEAADGSGLSLFVRWATAAGAGVPVY